MPSHPLLKQLDLALEELVPRHPVVLTGEWSPAARRTYKSEAQLGSGAGPFADVVDLRWRGTLSSDVPLGGMALLLSEESLYWSKAPEFAAVLPFDVSMHAYADRAPGRATFTANLADAVLPGIAVRVGSELAEACKIDEGVVTTGRISRLAAVDSASLYALIFPRALLKVGRKRLWRVRDEIASALSGDVRTVLTRRRAGTVSRSGEP